MTKAKTPSEPRRDPGRPPEMKGGKRVNVYLDADSLDRAAQLGGGNVSEGVRLALARAVPSPKRLG
jgi:post-segregation antitoxin (ccd killing protein)